MLFTLFAWQWRYWWLAVTSPHLWVKPQSRFLLAILQPLSCNISKMGAGLESLASQVARTTTTFGVIVQKHGASGAEQLVKSEISKTIPSYQSRWDQNLASIYSKHFSADELRSLVTQGTSSPYVGKFRSTQAVVATEMRATSSPLLQQLVTEALSNAVKQ